MGRDLPFDDANGEDDDKILNNLTVNAMDDVPDLAS